MSIVSNVQIFKILAIGVIVLILSFFTSCSTEYTGQYFSYPPGSKPHQKNWEYKAIVLVSSNKKPITKKSKKRVQIKVYDKIETTILNDEFEFVGASIYAKVVWKKFDDIKIELLEVGNKYAKDKYNKKLIQSGPNRLIEVNYKYDQQSKKFKKERAEKKAIR
jgi:hypothetical protein